MTTMSNQRTQEDYQNGTLDELPFMVVGEKGARNSIFGTINITQNADERLGAMGKKDLDNYNNAKSILQNPKATAEQIKDAESTLSDIYNRKSAEMQEIFNEITKFVDVKLSLEDAAGSWLGGGEYSFVVRVEAKSQDEYDKAIQAFSYVAEAARQDAFIENLGEVDESEVTDEGLLNKEYTKAIHISLKKNLTQQELAIVQDVFNSKNSGELPINSTITADEIVFYLPTWILGDTFSIEEYQELSEKWLNKIINIYNDEKEQRLSGLVKQPYRPTHERSRFHEARNAYFEEEDTRDYSSFGDNYLSKRGISQESSRVLQISEGQRIKSAVERIIGASNTTPSNDELQTFTTSFGVVYGFIDPKTLQMYLDEDNKLGNDVIISFPNLLSYRSVNGLAYTAATTATISAATAVGR